MWVVDRETVWPRERKTKLVCDHTWPMPLVEAAFQDTLTSVDLICVF